MAKTNGTTQPTDKNIQISDVTTNDVSTSKHGFVPKAPNDSTKFLNGVGAFAVPTASASIDYPQVLFVQIFS